MRANPGSPHTLRFQIPLPIFIRENWAPPVTRILSCGWTRQHRSTPRGRIGIGEGNAMVARRFVVRQGPAAAGEGEAEEHEVEYDTDHGIDVLRLQIFSLTSVPPDDQKIVVEADGSVVDDGTNLEAISERLLLLAVGEEEGVADTAAEAARAQEKSDEELARMLQLKLTCTSVALSSASELLMAEEEALLLQQYTVRTDGGEVFRQRVEPYMNQVLMYEDPARQEAARKTVPINELQEKALVSLAKEGNFSPSKEEEDHGFLLQLLFWFKQSFRSLKLMPSQSFTFNLPPTFM
ncbi:hypothetical protein PR202_gb20866 [Eleusine coracana subsp. coracana]|uniref:Uncharacterized protein n=1 Tax=Eleusine coracana subsp. coracana TaxID=191504 RepID=A0AAV5FBK7_ELECO|nr:hypothetical protein PR202_gb20866 [Eleusine coracana subsp. coracana]